MTADQAVAFLLFSVVAAGTPGPSNVLITATAAQVGFRRGLPCLFGVAVGMGVMMFVVGFGLGSVILGQPMVSSVLKWVGVAFLLWLAWKIATAPHGTAATHGKPVGFLGAATFQWVNPKSWLICVSAAGTYLNAGTAGAFTQAFALGALFTLATLPCCGVWLAFGASVQRLLRTPRAQRIFNLNMGALLAASVVLIVL